MLPSYVRTCSLWSRGRSFCFFLAQGEMPHIVSGIYLVHYSAVSYCPLTSVSSKEVQLITLSAALIRPFCSHIMGQITQLSVLSRTNFVNMSSADLETW